MDNFMPTNSYQREYISFKKGITYLTQSWKLEKKISNDLQLLSNCSNKIVVIVVKK